MGPRNLLFYCLAAVASVSLTVAVSSDDDHRKLPDGFHLGTATASYQIEGAWNISGKGQSIWDNLMMTRPDFTVDHQWGDVACDSYHQSKRDVEMLKELGLDVYRFSLSWSRILPTGFNDVVNQDGVKYYNDLITSLHAANITPMITLYHWDLPQPLQDLGGWPNPLLADYFADYAETAFRLFGDQVKWWLTFNEPFETCVGGYTLGSYAPAIKRPGVNEYLCAHTILRAHAKAYHLYKAKFAGQHGKIGITLNSRWIEPKDAKAAGDPDAAERMIQFDLGWFAHPIFKKGGNYPPVMIERIQSASLAQGLTRSRLPKFTKQEIQELQGSADFFGLNHYSTVLASHTESGDWPTPSRDNDISVEVSVDPSWPTAASHWLKVVPWGLRKLLHWIKTEYNDPPVYITENGYSDHGQLDDKERISYHSSYLEEMLNAIYKYKCNVIGYTAWSLMDNFEWRQGYSEKFGLYQVNFSDPARTRTPKSSVTFFQKLAKTRMLPSIEKTEDKQSSENLAESCLNPDSSCSLEDSEPSVKLV